MARLRSGKWYEEAKAMRERASRRPFRKEGGFSPAGGQLGCAVGTVRHRPQVRTLKQMVTPDFHVSRCDSLREPKSNRV